ncbi:MAG TPA: class I SAM-dependent methyltransferase [Bryobacteraceae bacterium]|nr:class I SAM-dependent methyltransferase [Bryobacteraceae bacterium]
MPVRDFMELWDAVHRWDWFRRGQWLGNFREGKRLLAASIAGVLKDLGLAEGLVLDCSCGLGFQAIVLREAGLRVHGADRGEFAVDRARELARDVGHEIDFFVSRWDELPAKTQFRFDAVFCDALSWLHTDEEMVAALRGLRGVLQAGGVLIFQGAPQGSDAADLRRDSEDWWANVPSASLRWSHTEGAVSCTALSVPSRGDDYIDWRQLYLIDENGAKRLEHITLRESLRWNARRFTEMARAAGFDCPVTRAVQAWSPGGRPAALNYAVPVGATAASSG